MFCEKSSPQGSLVENELSRLRELLFKDQFEEIARLGRELETLKTEMQNFDGLTPVLDRIVEHTLTNRIDLKGHLQTLVESEVNGEIYRNKERFTESFAPFIHASLTHYIVSNFKRALKNKVFLSILIGISLILLSLCIYSLYNYFQNRDFETFQNGLHERIAKESSLVIYDLVVEARDEGYYVSGVARTSRDFEQMAGILVQIPRPTKVINAITLLQPTIDSKKLDTHIASMITLFNKTTQSTLTYTFKHDILQLYVTGKLGVGASRENIIEALKRIDGLKTIFIDLDVAPTAPPPPPPQIQEPIAQEPKVETLPTHEVPVVPVEKPKNRVPKVKKNVGVKPVTKGIITEPKVIR